MAFKKRGILKSFAPFKTFGLFQMFWKPYPKFKMLLWKDASNPLFVFLKILRKAASSKWRFPKMDLRKPVFKAS
jgi:hypothetical protein